MRSEREQHELQSSWHFGSRLVLARMVFLRGRIDGSARPTTSKASNTAQGIPSQPEKKRSNRSAVELFIAHARGIYLRTTAAVQLISTSDWPGSAAIATVVLAGPPWRK